ADAVTTVTAYARRFGLVYFALAAVVGAAIGGTIVLASRGGHSHSPWSAWQPTTSGELRTKEIANRVATAYHLRNGRPLVDVVAFVEFLPGGATARPNLALFFRRPEVEPFLSHPLRATLPRKPQPATARRIDELTLTHMFRFTLQPAQAGGGLLVLDRG